MTLTFDLESGVRVTCDISYLCANISFPRILCSQLRPDVRDRHQTDVRQHHRTEMKCNSKLQYTVYC